MHFNLHLSHSAHSGHRPLALSPWCISVAAYFGLPVGQNHILLDWRFFPCLYFEWYIIIISVFLNISFLLLLYYYILLLYNNNNYISLLLYHYYIIIIILLLIFINILSLILLFYYYYYHPGAPLLRTTAGLEGAVHLSLLALLTPSPAGTMPGVGCLPSQSRHPGPFYPEVSSSPATSPHPHCISPGGTARDSSLPDLSPSCSRREQSKGWTVVKSFAWSGIVSL